jgi:SAM-dependent methyltransferase
MSTRPRVHEGDEERLIPGTPLWDAHHAEHLQRYEFAARSLTQGARVLDAGCGVGYGAAYLVDRGASAVAAVDASAEALAIGQRTFARPRITWIQEDCHQLERAGTMAPFDLIVNLENLEHLSDPERFLDRARSLLSSAGVFVTSSPSRIGNNRLRGVGRNEASLNPFHVHEFDSAELRALLTARYREVTLAWQVIDPIDRMAWEPALAALWSNPAVRLGRWIQRTVRRRPVPDRLEDLLPRRAHRIVDSDPGDEMSVTLLAVCRGPRT